MNYQGIEVQALSAARLAPYREPGDMSLREAIARYLWNMELSEALHPALHATEVSLRNSIHRILTIRTGRPDWYDCLVPTLRSNEAMQIPEARKRLSDHGKADVPDRVIAELNFGFWTGLFAGYYEQPLWHSNLKLVFPNAPRSLRSAQALRTTLERIRRLRNRVYHYEPIWHWTGLPGLHASILAVCTAINSDWSATAALIDRFATVHAAGPLSRLADLP